MKVKVTIASIENTPPLEVLETVIHHATLSTCRKVFAAQGLGKDATRRLAQKNAKAAVRNMTKAMGVSNG